MPVVSYRHSNYPFVDHLWQFRLSLLVIPTSSCLSFFDAHEKFGPYPDNFFYLSQNKSTTYVLPRTAIQQPAKNSVTPSAGWKPALPGNGCSKLPPIGKNFRELLFYRLFSVWPRDLDLDWTRPKFLLGAFGTVYAAICVAARTPVQVSSAATLRRCCETAD